MSASDPAHNKRKSVRFAVAKPRRQSTLIVGKRAFPVHLTDESLGGFAVLINQSPGLRVGEVAQLQTDYGLFGVRLVRIARAESPLNHESSNTDEPSQWHLLGLCRIGEVFLPPPKTASMFSESASIYRGQTESRNWILTACGLILVFIIIAIPLGISGFHWNSRHRETNGSAETDSPEARSNRKLSNSIRSTPGAKALLLPEVAGELSLTKDQTEGIRRLLDDLSKALQTLDQETSAKNLQPGEVSQVRDQLNEESRKEALKLLDSKQRSKWKELDPEP